MLNINGNKIYLTRGDTLLLDVQVKKEDGGEYTPTDTDKVFFRLKKSSAVKALLIEKEVPVDTMTLQLDEADTEGLRFGVYYYEIELVTAEGNHYTIIENEKFEIGAELENHG